jgi:PleD family two-component response regulator
MHILIVDDAPEIRRLVRAFLEKGGFSRISEAASLKVERDRRPVRESELLKVKGELEAANQELRRLPSIDVFTGIPNRRRFDEVLGANGRAPCAPGARSPCP